MALKVLSLALRNGVGQSSHCCSTIELFVYGAIPKETELRNFCLRSQMSEKLPYVVGLIRLSALFWGTSHVYVLGRSLAN